MLADGQGGWCVIQFIELYVYNGLLTGTGQVPAVNHGSSSVTVASVSTPGGNVMATMTALMLATN